MKRLAIIIIFTFCLFSSANAAEKQEAYFIPIIFDKGVTIFGENVTKGFSFIPGSEPAEIMSQYKYYLELVSSEGKTLEKKMFSIHNEISYAPPIEGEEWEYDEIQGTIIEERVEHIEILPYYKNATLLRLHDANKRIIDQKDISFLAIKQDKVIKKEFEKTIEVDDSIEIKKKLIVSTLLFILIIVLSLYIYRLFFHKKKFQD